jgi:hypothetical protein
MLTSCLPAAIDPLPTIISATWLWSPTAGRISKGNLRSVASDGFWKSSLSRKPPDHGALQEISRIQSPKLGKVISVSYDSYEHRWLIPVPEGWESQTVPFRASSNVYRCV